MFKLNNSINVTPDEITKVIGDYNLHIYQNIWHYSFNDIFQQTDFKFETRTNGIKILYSRAYNTFSPLLIYTNVDSNLFVKENHAIQGEYDQSNENYRHIFWFLKTISFNNFLERRSKNSSKPRKHFPTLESYDKYKSKINGEVVYDEFNKDFFFQNYNNLKNPEHLSGEIILEMFFKNNPHINIKWLRTASLYHNNSIVAIGILVDDAKSLSLENIAAKRDSLSFGVVLCAEIVKYCCENDYYSFDAGVSGLYGSYKGKIFLDSKEVYKTKPPLTDYLSFWKKEFWQKVSKKIKTKLELEGDDKGK